MSFFLVVDGIDGAGKSSQIARMLDYLHDRGVSAIRTREPGGSPVGEQIRTLLLSDRDEVLTPKTEVLLFFAARIQHVETIIKPRLNEGTAVICDRFCDSTYAYQCAQGLPEQDVDTIMDYSLGGFKPDLTLMFDLSPEIAEQRTNSRGDKNHFDRFDPTFFAKTREIYFERVLKDPERYVLIDADGSMDDTWRQIKVWLDVLIERYWNHTLPT